ncbi:septum formation initiator family protein [Candidatus Uhrbacteria bacterium]|nr:septum formation initiator family protein [Candidatus Uhrbacteria bacterium]
MKSRSPRSSWRATVVFAVSTLALAGAAAGIVQEWERRRSVQREMRAIAEEVARLEQQRSRLTDLLEQTEHPEFIEREARLRMGLQRPGETVLVIPETSLAAHAATESGNGPSPESNVRKWWHHIFR